MVWFNAIQVGLLTVLVLWFCLSAPEVTTPWFSRL